jgi:hypothetical protein
MSLSTKGEIAATSLGQIQLHLDGDANHFAAFAPSLDPKATRMPKPSAALSD